MPIGDATAIDISQEELDEALDALDCFQQAIALKWLYLIAMLRHASKRGMRYVRAGSICATAYERKWPCSTSPHVSMFMARLGLEFNGAAQKRVYRVPDPVELEGLISRWLEKEIGFPVATSNILAMDDDPVPSTNGKENTL
jgi:hypothetical protein